MRKSWPLISSRRPESDYLSSQETFGGLRGYCDFGLLIVLYQILLVFYMLDFHISIELGDVDNIDMTISWVASRSCFAGNLLAVPHETPEPFSFLLLIDFKVHPYFSSDVLS